MDSDDERHEPLMGLAKRRMAELLKEKKIAPAELARMLNTSDAQISRLISGTQKIDLNWLSRFAEALGVHPESIISDNPLVTSPSRAVDRLAMERALFFLQPQLAEDRPDITPDLFVALVMAYYDMGKSQMLADDPQPLSNETVDAMIRLALGRKDG